MVTKSTKTKKVKVDSQPKVEELETKPQAVEQPEVVQEPKPEVLPKGVLRMEVVDINSKKYRKYYRVDGTTDVRLVE